MVSTTARGFKFLGEWIDWDNIEEKTRTTFNNKKGLSWNNKIKHYSTLIKPEALFPAKTLVKRRKGKMDELKIMERKILRKVMGPKF